MISASFRIKLLERLWVAELSTEFSRATLRLLSGYRTGDTALELGEVLAETPSVAVESMRSHPSMEAFELLDSEDGRSRSTRRPTPTCTRSSRPRH
jgi:hypothetical protein